MAVIPYEGRTKRRKKGDREGRGDRGRRWESRCGEGGKADGMKKSQGVYSIISGDVGTTATEGECLPGQCGKIREERLPRPQAR